jgi:hypothetical protein
VALGERLMVREMELVAVSDGLAVADADTDGVFE